MSGDSSINLLGRREINNPANQDVFERKPFANLLDNALQTPPNTILSNEQNWQTSFLRRSLEQKLETQQTVSGDLNGLSEQTPVTVEIKPQDTQADALRRAYQHYAKTAGLSEEGQKAFVESMNVADDALILHRDTGKAFTAKEFEALKRGKGNIDMYPTAAQIAELHSLKRDENEVISVESKAYAQPGEITFKDTNLASQNFAVVRRYLQQNLLGADFYFVEHGDEATSRALALGVKPELEEIGKNDAGATVYRVKITPEDDEKLKQVADEYNQKKAVFEQKMAQARSEVNQMFADQGRVLWNSAVNIVEGTVNLAIDAALSKGGQNPLVLTNPYRPQVDFSGAKSPYRSEMMRRDINGVVDGDGIKKGEAIETGVTILAPLVVGRVMTPKAAPQSLKTLGGLPEAEVSTAQTVAQTTRKVGKIEIETGRKLSPSEQRFADKMAAEGKVVKARKEVNQQGVKNPDFDIDNEIVEFKHISDLKGKDANSLSGGLSRRILDGGSQASKVTLDVSDQAGMTREIAERAIRRAFGNQARRGSGAIKEVRIYGKDFDFTISFVSNK